MANVPSESAIAVELLLLLLLLLSDERDGSSGGDGWEKGAMRRGRRDSLQGRSDGMRGARQF